MKPLLLALLTVLALPLCGRAAPAASPPNPFLWGASHVADAGWGRMIRLADGRWLAVGTLYPSKTTHVLQLKLSRDNARTWTTLSTVAEEGRQMDNGELIQLADGTILLTGRSIIDKQSYHLPVYQSKDGGAHWAFLSQIDTNDAVVQNNVPSQGLWEPHFFKLAAGYLAVAYATEKHVLGTPAYSQTYSQICAERVSGDGGKTWGPESVLVSQPGGGSLRPGMPVVTQMQDGRYIEVSEIVGRGHADVYCKLSPDGLIWPPGLGTAIPDHHAGPWVASLTDGRLVVTSCANQISYSDDCGTTWTRAAPAWDIGFVLSWPAIYQTGPNEIAVMNTYRGINIRFGAYQPR